MSLKKKCFPRSPHKEHIQLLQEEGAVFPGLWTTYPLRLKLPINDDFPSAAKVGLEPQGQSSATGAGLPMKERHRRQFA